jgi:hypothetical protein
MVNFLKNCYDTKIFVCLFFFDYIVAPSLTIVVVASTVVAAQRVRLVACRAPPVELVRCDSHPKKKSEKEKEEEEQD